MAVVPVKKHPANRSPFSAPGVGGVTFGTLTAEAADSRTQSIQLTDQQGRNRAVPDLVWVWLSTNSTGIDIVASAASSALAAGTDGSVVDAGISGKTSLFMSEADGDLDVVITDTAARTLYLCVQTVDGFAVSGAIVFA